MKGNEAVAEAAIRAGADGYFGYPITPRVKYLNTLWQLSLMRQQVWLSFRQRVKLRP
jgi:pyruvate/2-oxoacid:ferredoxin oxidoreductase alpha subunit